MQMRQTLEIKVNDSTWIRFRDNELTIQKVSQNYGWPMGNSSQLIELTIDEAQQIIDAVKMVQLTKTGYNVKNVEVNQNGRVRKRRSSDESKGDGSDNGKLTVDHIRRAVDRLKQSGIQPLSTADGFNEAEIEEQNPEGEEEQ